VIGISGHESFAFLVPLLRQGLFSAARRSLDERRHLAEQFPIEFKILRSELSLELGNTAEASDVAKTCLSRKTIDSSQKARALAVLAMAAFYKGSVEQSTKMLAQALRASEQGAPALLRAYIALLEFSIGLHVHPIENVLATLGDIRRMVIRAADPHLIVLLRIAVARAEARYLSPWEAQRHHRAGLALLEMEPNVWLEGLLNIDMAAFAMILGDLESSSARASRAIELSRESGHARTKNAGTINLSQVLTWQGRFEEARHLIQGTLGSAVDNAHLRRCSLDSLANLLISEGAYQECVGVFRDLAIDSREHGKNRPHWDTSTEIFSLARLARAERRYEEAISMLERALLIAEKSNDQIWKRRIRSAMAECYGMLGLSEEAMNKLGNLHPYEARDPESLSRHYGTLAAVAWGRGQRVQAKGHLRRATRIATGIGNQSLLVDLERAVGTVLAEEPVTEVEQTVEPPPVHLDAAVALLELSGHPHILGREAVALLQDTGCAECVALAARGDGGTRLIVADGWTEPEALAAIAAARPDDLLTIGDHRDETWVLLARPRAELEQQCTLAAIKKLVATARTIEQYRRDEKQRAALWPAEELDGDADSLWISERSADLLRIARRIANAPIAILLTGETGTGKEMLARVIHRASTRADKPFQPFNCTAVPRDMVESQLFGYRKGAFTGAETAFPGVIRAATGGTLFLDEIGDVSLDMQPKLLRFLEHQEVHPLGEPHAVKVDVRIIAATNGNLDQLVTQGRFREDLFYRLKVLHLHLPPLRDRREEIPALTQHYIRKFSDEQRKGTLTLSDETLEYLLLYPWPGNIRQLANEIQRMVAFAEIDATLTPSLLSPEILASRRTIAVSASHAEAEMRVRLDQPLPAAVEALERTLVRRALERSHGRVEEAARLLGISRKGLFLKRRRWGLRQAS
jgi:DNA-binding NtrC family response regulator/tetratricopeptide (TPR) repeat protein